MVHYCCIWCAVPDGSHRWIPPPPPLPNWLFGQPAVRMDSFNSCSQITQKQRGNTKVSQVKSYNKMQVKVLFVINDGENNISILWGAVRLQQSSSNVGWLSHEIIIAGGIRVGLNVPFQNQNTSDEASSMWRNTEHIMSSWRVIEHGHLFPSRWPNCDILMSKIHIQCFSAEAQTTGIHQ